MEVIVNYVSTQEDIGVRGLRVWMFILENVSDSLPDSSTTSSSLNNPEPVALVKS